MEQHSIKYCKAYCRRGSLSASAAFLWKNKSRDELLDYFVDKIYIDDDGKLSFVLKLYDKDEVELQEVSEDEIFDFVGVEVFDNFGLCSTKQSTCLLPENRHFVDGLRRYRCQSVSPSFVFSRDYLAAASCAAEAPARRPMVE